MPSGVRRGSDGSRGAVDPRLPARARRRLRPAVRHRRLVRTSTAVPSHGRRRTGRPDRPATGPPGPAGRQAPPRRTSHTRTARSPVGRRQPNPTELAASAPGIGGPPDSTPTARCSGGSQMTSPARPTLRRAPAARWPRTRPPHRPPVTRLQKPRRLGDGITDALLVAARTAASYAGRRCVEVPKRRRF
jgi:hypothetical protein